MKHRLLVGLILVIFMVCTSQTFSRIGQDSGSITDAKGSTIQALSYSPNLEAQLRRAETIIELQNSQLTQTNELLSQFWGALGVTLTGLAIVLVLQFFGPAKKLLEQTRNLQIETQELLNNVETTLGLRVAQHFNKINDRRFDLALTTLRDSNQWRRIGRPIFEDFVSRGLSESQEDKLIKKMKTDLALPPQPLLGMSRTDFFSVGLLFTDIFTAHQRSPKIEKFLTDYFSNEPYGNHEVCRAYRLIAIGYLGKFIDVDLYELASYVVSAHSPRTEYNTPMHLGIHLGHLLHKVRATQPQRVGILFHDQRFVKALDERSMLDAYLARSLDEAGHLDESIYKAFPNFLNSPFEKALMDKGAKRPVLEPHKPLQ